MKPTLSFTPLIAALLLLMGAELSGRAQVVMFNISGNLYQKIDTNNVLPASITSTSAFTGTVSYDVSIGIDNAPGDTNYGYYIFNTGVGGLTMNIDIAGNSFIDVEVPYDVCIIHKDPGTTYDEFLLETAKYNLNGNPVPNATSTSMDVELRDPSANAIDSELRPLAAPDLSKFPFRLFSAYAGTNGVRIFYLAGEITNITQLVPPSLAISRTNATNAVISWTQLATNYLFEQSLTVTGAWSQVKSSYVTNAGQISATVPATNASKFYRLRLP